MACGRIALASAIASYILTDFGVTSGLNVSCTNQSAYMPYLVDSDVLIDISRGNAAAREYVDALPEAWAISRVSALSLEVPNYR